MKKIIFIIDQKNEFGHHELHKLGSGGRTWDLNEDLFELTEVLFESDNFKKWGTAVEQRLKYGTGCHFILYNDTSMYLIENVSEMRDVDAVSELSKYDKSEFKLTLFKGARLVNNLTELEIAELDRFKNSMSRIKEHLTVYKGLTQFQLKGITRKASYSMDVKTLFHPITESKLVGLVNLYGDSYSNDAMIEVVHSDRTIVLELNEDFIRARTQELDIHKANAVNLVFLEELDKLVGVSDNNSTRISADFFKRD